MSFFGSLDPSTSLHNLSILMGQLNLPYYYNFCFSSIIIGTLMISLIIIIIFHIIVIHELLLGIGGSMNLPT
jgi:hypothetical protein